MKEEQYKPIKVRAKECNWDAKEIRKKALAVRVIAAENIANRRKKDKEKYDKGHRGIHFNPGDRVRIFFSIRKTRSEKLLLRWFGPYEIVRKVGSVDYKVKNYRVKKEKPI